MNNKNDVINIDIFAGKDRMGLATTVLCIMHRQVSKKLNLTLLASITEMTSRNKFKDLKNRLEVQLD